MKLEGKKAIVTGGTRGIGKAIVEQLVINGCDVVFTYHSSEESAKELENELQKYQRKVFGIKADAANFQKLKKLLNLLWKI